MQNILTQNPKLQMLLTYKNDKKIVKNTIINIHLVDCIDLLAGYGFKLSAKFILGIVKVYTKKIKYVMDDTSELYNKFRPQKTQKKLLQHINKLEIDFSDVYHPEEDIYHDVIESFVNDVNDNIVSDMNFSMTRVEAARGDEFKRRKIDDVIEIDSSMIKMRFNRNKIVEKQEVSNNLPEFIRDIFTGYGQSVEVARADSMVGNYEPDYSTFEMHSANDADSLISSEVDLDILDDVFCFNEYASSDNRYTKAKKFLHILGMCSNGKMGCSQKEEYGNIMCHKIN